MLDCVVFGRVAGAAYAKYILGDRVKATSLADLLGGGLSEKVAEHTKKGDVWVVFHGRVLRVYWEKRTI